MDLLGAMQCLLLSSLMVSVNYRYSRRGTCDTNEFTGALQSCDK